MIAYFCGLLAESSFGWLILGVALKFIPIFGLCLISFRLRVDARQCALLIAGASAATMLYAVLARRPTLAGGWSRLLCAALFMFGCLLVLYLLLESTASQIAFVLFLTRNCTDTLWLLSAYLQSLLGAPSSHVTLLFQTGLTLVCSPLMVLFFVRLVRPLTSAGNPRPFGKYLWMIPVSFYLVYRLGISPHYFNPMADCGNSPFLLSCTWGIGTFLSYIVILKTLSEAERAAALQEKLHISEIQISMQVQQRAALQQSIEENHRIRHDMHHHMLALAGYIDRGDNEGMRDYLGRYLDEVSHTIEESPPYCENGAVDGLVRYYAAQAERIGVRFTARLNLPPELPLQENDFCVALGNLLENAVEACGRQKSGERFIRLHAEITGTDMLALSVSNSFEGPIRRPGGAFLSSKRPGIGIGTASVRCIAQKYHGVARFRQEDGVFTAFVLLVPDTDAHAAK